MVRTLPLYRVVTAVAALLAVSARAADARAEPPSTGTIICIVRDASGGAVPGATVRALRAGSSGPAAEAVTDASGFARVDSLEPGEYEVETTLDGFEADTRSIAVGAGSVSIGVELAIARLAEAVVVTARRFEEKAQEVPTPLSVLSGATIDDTGAFNVNRLTELVPSLQFYSTNPRNSAINIRGLGSPFGLTNDGLETGVGLYVDGVFYARPASATLDFLDVDRVEVLRGPQGTLFGKNTTAGAISVTTRQPSFTRGADVEFDLGNIGFVQAKGSATGPLAKSLAGRVSFSGTTREGTIANVRTHENVNALNNAGVRGQLLFAPSDAFALTVAVDDTRQRANGYTQVIAGVAPTERAPNRQYAPIAAALGYTPPSFNAFDRVTDVDTPLRSSQDLGGAAVTSDWKAGRGRVTSTTAWRFWNWDPSSDRDFTGLPVTTISAAPSTQRQWTQEVRYAADPARRVSFVAGAFAFRQTVESNPAFVQEQGAAAAAFLLAPGAAATAGLLDGYGYRQYVNYSNASVAGFGQLQWSLSDRVRVLPGARVNHDRKHVAFDQDVYGGLQTDDPALIALKQSVLAPQSYTADVADTRTSGQLTIAVKLSNAVNGYATYATGFKPVGLNLNGLPTDAQNRPVLGTAIVKPEDVRNLELGVKTTPRAWATINVAAYDTDVRDFQVQVTNGAVGVIRGYLANAPRVRVRGVEIDASARPTRTLSLSGAASYTDGRYVTFADAPPPLEQTGGPSFVDASGSVLPGISRWAGSVAAEFDRPASIAGRAGDLFGSVDASARSSFSSSATYSRYLVASGYALFNARVGFRAANGWTLFVWSRNLLDARYFELLSAAPGNTGLYVGQPGDPRTVGLTLRLALHGT